MKKRQRLYFVLFILAALSGAVGLSLYALQDNLSFFYSPRETVSMRAAQDARVAEDRLFRIGGLVVAGSVVRGEGDPPLFRFDVTDGVQTVKVVYRGIPPDLFRDGQGVVARGSLDGDGIFQARELLAKHDENYMPPEVAKSLKRAHEEGKRAMEEGAAE